MLTNEVALNPRNSLINPFSTCGERKKKGWCCIYEHINTLILDPGRARKTLATHKGNISINDFFRAHNQQ